MFSFRLWLWCGLTTIHFGLAAQHPETAPTIEAVNATVAYLNASVEWAWVLHKDLETINRSLFYVQKNGETQPFPSGSNSVNDHLTRPLLPSLSTRTWSENLFQYDQHLAKGAKALQQLVLLQNSSSLTHTTEQQQLRQQLDAFADWFEQLNSLHTHLRETLVTTVRELNISEERDPYWLASEELRQMVHLGRQLLQQLKSADWGSIRLSHSQLSQAMARAPKRKAALLSQIPARPGSNADPSLRYEAVLAQTRALLQLAEQSLQQAPVDPYFQAQGAAYYHFNQFLVNKFSRKGESLVEQFNRFVTLSAFPIPKEVGELNWFQTTRVSPTPLPGPIITRENNAPVHLIFLLDVSGSMKQAEKFPLFQRSFMYLISQLEPSDRISLVSYSGETNVVAEAVSPRKNVLLSQAIHGLSAEGKTDAYTGLKTAYDLAVKHQDTIGQTKLILISDGGFELEGRIVSLVQSAPQDRISLSTFYMGQQESQARSRLRPLAVYGNGNYTYVRPENALETLLRELNNTELSTKIENF